ncbi:MAG TPA: TIGR01212 family radical SAM protein [Bacteroidales bacterium]|nr:TIGR01212 family radical SAM protein [Bacteroidales bacterium]
MSSRYNSFSDFIRQQFGGRVQKVAVNAGFTCPNRDGTKGRGGCTYCDNAAFNPSYCDPRKSITRQIKEGIEFHAVRYRRASRYLVYFQPFSNTYAELPALKEKFAEALSCPGVAGLVIGTRPDCMDEEKLDYLAGLARVHFIQVEYGIESIYDRTLERINRGHDFATSREMLEKTRERGIRTGAHFIFGLPGESLQEMMDSAAVISRLAIDTVKFHQLQIIKGTRMEQEFREHRSDFHVFDLDGYIDFIIRFLEKLNPAFLIERFTGEVPPRFIEGHNLGLLRYDEVLRKIGEELERRDSWQGKNFTG